MMKKNIAVIFEIFLLVCMNVSISYSIGEINKIRDYSREETAFAGLLRFIEKIIFDNFALASALELSDLSNGAYTCLETNEGKYCQEYAASECNSKCKTNCLPSQRKDVSECMIGICYDQSEGTCQYGSPKSLCEKNGGKWYAENSKNIKECRKGCCIAGQEADFVTEKQCERISAMMGIETSFRPEINTELSCLEMSKSLEEGACVFDEEIERTCKFTTKIDCLRIGGNFFSGLLCSNSELKTNCKPQQRAGCVEGKDEIYWFDSCGNRENIYDANKVRSYNNGKVMLKNESCSLSFGNNLFANQKTCGNCNYLLGSICNIKTKKEKLADNSQNVVCRDLSCTDSNGIKRKHGESWCVYQGSIGVDETNDRSTDTPGSRHFRQTCIDGEIQTEPCADYRNEICIESKTQVLSGTFSSAACRINRWQECLAYNTEFTELGKRGEKKRNNICETNPDCFIKEVDIDDKFKFNICAPKYPPGFDLKMNSDSAETVCSLASQKCTIVYVKDWKGHWDCKANCDCEKKEFTEKMNNLCMSLGDCGASVNFIGDYGEGYSVYKVDDLSEQYKSGLKKYSEPVKGKVAEAGNISEFYGSIGIPKGLGEAENLENPNELIINTALYTAGAVGVGLAAAAYLAPSASISIGAGQVIGPILTKLTLGKIGTSLGMGSASNPSLVALGGAIAGASIGLAVTSLLIKFTGISAGLPKPIIYGLLSAGTFSGSIMGYAAVTQGFSLNSGWLGPLAVWIAVAIVIMVIVMKLLGVGKTKKVVVEFSCQPWQAPYGGAKCKECGKDGLPCSRYACQSLGQTCELINENTKESACVDINPNDVAAPLISPWRDAMSPDYTIAEETENGIKIIGREECIPENAKISFGITLNEPGRCRLDTEHTTSYDKMEFEFGGRSVFIINHSMLIQIPSLESIGASGYDPNKKADYSLFVRCEDKRGNRNIKEYEINFCVKPGEDITPTKIVSRQPMYEYVAYNTTQIIGAIYTEEPAECKWDERDTSYELMSNIMNCANDIEDREFLGWRCETVFPVKRNETKYYIRCKDQPWLNESQKRNVNQESYVFSIKKSLSNLKIDNIEPNGTLVFGNYPMNIEVIVKTSGGADGTATCYYEFGRYVMFKDTLKNIHKQPFQWFTDGKREINIKCEDEAGNIANGLAKFELKIDNQKPVITRVYVDAGKLNIITNEKAECRYLNSEKLRGDVCNFKMDNATLMDGTEFVHTTEFIKDSTYYVKCVDEFGNYPGTCSMIIRGVEI